MFLTDAEDKDNCHGKPMGKETESSIEAIKALIQNNGPHGVQLTAPSAPVAAPSTEKLALSEPPSYKLGDKVRGGLLTRDGVRQEFIDYVAVQYFI